MESIGKITIEVLMDRDVKKLRVNLIKDGLIFGWLKPVKQIFKF